MRRLLLSECAFNRFDDCYAHILALWQLTPFFRLVHISLALPLYVCTCVFAQAGRRFYIPALITLVPLKTLCILFKLDEFRFFFYLLFFLWFHFICSMLGYHRLLVFFSFRLCSLFSFFVPYWLYALQVNEIKNLQWKVKREEKKKSAENEQQTYWMMVEVYIRSLFDVWCLMMIIQNMCTCYWLQEISSKHYTIRGHTKSTNASNQNQNQPI